MSKFHPTDEERRKYNLAFAEERAVREGLIYVKGNLSHAAVLLGKNRRTLQRNYPHILDELRVSRPWRGVDISKPALRFP